MLSNKLKKLLFDYFILVSGLIISSLFIIKLVADKSWLTFNIGFWLFLMFGLTLIFYDNYLAFIIGGLIGLVLFVSFFVFKSKNLDLNNFPMSNNISTELKADQNSFNILAGLLLLITIITIVCFFIIKKFNFKRNNAEPKQGLEGEKEKEGQFGEESYILNKPNSIVYENLKVMANDHFIKRKKEIMRTWDYNNRKQHYKEELPSVFDFNESNILTTSIVFKEILDLFSYGFSNSSLLLYNGFNCNVDVL